MISFDQTEFQLGNVSYGETKVSTVNITNKSTQYIKLSVANASCSCTTGSLKSTSLSPGDKTQLLISLNSKKAGKGANQVKTIQMQYVLSGTTYNQLFRLKANIV